MYAKFIQYFLALIFTFFSAYAKADDPSILEMRQMQSRKYNVPVTEFLKGLNEVCKVRGGTLAGYYAGNQPLNLASLEAGNMNCSPFDSKTLNSRGYSMTRLNIQGSIQNDNFLQVRIIANSFVDDGPGRKKTVPVIDKNIYSIIFKDISDAIGVQDIPVQIKMAE
jgi:hypothetical protein